MHDLLPLQAAAVACCSWWRHESALPEEAWKILESLAPTATPLVADRIANFVWWNDKQATLRDWHLVTALPFAPSQNGLAGQIAARASDTASNSIDAVTGLTRKPPRMACSSGLRCDSVSRP